MTQSLTIRRPDDWHLHLRDGAMMRAVLPETARHFARAIVMPNLVPPVVTAAQAAAYRDRILAALPDGMAFQPLMTLYMTEDTDPEDVARAHADGIATAVKLYPAGATTNSASGVRDFDKVRGVLEKMAEIGMPLCMHGEVTTHDVDIFDREAVFIDTVLDPLRRATPGLRVVMEHITTAQAADYVRANETGLAATITTHHLIINRNHILAGGIKPHFYCLPVAKRETHRLALREAVAKAGSVLLEPIMKVVVTTPNEYMGNVTGDLSSRRGMILDQEDKGMIKEITAEVPLSELFGYTTVLRGLSQGRAANSMEFQEYRAMPASLQKEVIASGA